MNSDYLVFTKKLAYWEDLTKYAFLVQKIYSMFNEGDPPSITDLIGEPPKQKEESAPAPLEETESEKQWREWAEKNGHSVERTASGLKIKRSL